MSSLRSRGTPLSQLPIVDKLGYPTGKFATVDPEVHAELSEFTWELDDAGYPFNPELGRLDVVVIQRSGYFGALESLADAGELVPGVRQVANSSHPWMSSVQVGENLYHTWHRTNADALIAYIRDSTGNMKHFRGLLNQFLRYLQPTGVEHPTLRELIVVVYQPLPTEARLPDYQITRLDLGRSPSEAERLT